MCISLMHRLLLIELHMLKVWNKSLLIWTTTFAIILHLEFQILQEGQSTTGTTLLFSVFLGSMTLGTILMCFLHKRDIRGEVIKGEDIKGEEDLKMPYADCSSSIVSLLKSVLSPLCDKRMLLIIPLFAYSGLQQAFVW